MNESTVDYIKQLRNLSRKNFEYFDSMTEALLRSIDTGDKNNVVYLTGFLKGYESCRDDMLVAKKKEKEKEKVVDIKETIPPATPITTSPEEDNSKKYSDGSKSVSSMYM